MYNRNKVWGSNDEKGYASSSSESTSPSYSSSDADNGYNSGGSSVDYKANDPENNEKDEKKDDTWKSQLDETIEKETKQDTDDEEQSEFQMISKGIQQMGGNESEKNRNPQQFKDFKPNKASKKDKRLISIEEAIQKAGPKEKKPVFLND